jgi:hypothetical protein
MCSALCNRRHLLGLLYLRRKYRNRKASKRQYWVHPILKVRYLEGSFYTLFGKLKGDESKFFNYFRMSTQTFDFLIERLELNCCALEMQGRRGEHICFSYLCFLSPATLAF